MIFSQPTLLTFIAFSIASSASAASFQYEKTVPAEQIQMMEGDAAYLAHLKLKVKKSEIPRIQTLFGFSGPVNALAMQKWLSERAKVILPESWSLDANAVSNELPVTYPDGSMFAPFPGDAASMLRKVNSGEEREVVEIMANIGSVVYSLGKSLGKRFSITYNDQTVDAITPRIGLFQVGKGYFYDYYNGNPESANTSANRIERLAVLFHEARHSDGRGHSLGFLHSVCPDSMLDYAGFPACDSFLNGAYTIGANAYLMLTKSCKDCTTPQKEVIRAMAADSFARILPTRTYVYFPPYMNKFINQIGAPVDLSTPVFSVNLEEPSKNMNATPEWRIQ